MSSSIHLQVGSIGTQNNDIQHNQICSVQRHFSAKKTKHFDLSRSSTQPQSLSATTQSIHLQGGPIPTINGVMTPFKLPCKWVTLFFFTNYKWTYTYPLIFCARNNQVAGLWDTTAWLVISAFGVSLTFGTSRSSTTSRGLCTSRQNGVDLPGAPSG